MPLVCEADIMDRATEARPLPLQVIKPRHDACALIGTLFRQYSGCGRSADGAPYFTAEFDRRNAADNICREEYCRGKSGLSGVATTPRSRYFTELRGIAGTGCDSEFCAIDEARHRHLDVFSFVFATE